MHVSRKTKCKNREVSFKKIIYTNILIFLHACSDNLIIISDLTRPSIKLPKPLAEMIKLVHTTKWNLIKARQELNRSYKEICIPVLEKCRFLLYEVKPAVSIETEGFKRIDVLHREPRVKTLVKKVIKDLKCGSHTTDIQKPEDIINATLQSQSLERNKCNNEDAKPNIKKCSSDGKLHDSKSEAEEANNVIKNGTMTDSFHSNASKHSTTPKNCIDLKSELEEKWNLEKLESENYLEENEEDKQKKVLNDLNLCNLLNRLAEKQMKKLSSEKISLISVILEFVTSDSCDIESLRKAMYCQVKRSKIRKEGLQIMKHLLYEEYLLTSVKYSIINGYLNLINITRTQTTSFHSLDNIQLVAPYIKTEILLAQHSITEWCIDMLRSLILKDLPCKTNKLKYINTKINQNLGAYTVLRDIPRARMLLAILGMLTSGYYIATELNSLINSGVIGSVLTLLNQTSFDQSSFKKRDECYVLYADAVENYKPKSSTISGPELALMMKLGTRVVRGKDWKWGDQVDIYLIKCITKFSIKTAYI